MKQKTLVLLLKAVIIGVAVCAALVYCLIVPELGESLANAGDGEFSHLYTPWLAVILLTAPPVGAALVLSWIVATNIGKDRSFCRQNARFLALISLLAGIDTVYFLLASAVLMAVTKVGHPGVVLFILLVCFVGAAICVAAAALSHYAAKAAELQEQSDLTI
ncbi:MAG: DUF2975 domain-containing protein [Clostridia bacterium]|nr:DUF2975 domain-containing protein [Clostridia bacterium]